MRSPSSWRPRLSRHAASGGSIREIEAAEQIPGVTVFHAGTARSGEGLVAKGGRVLAVTAVADTFANARARAYRAVDQIDFADGFHRKDIGWRELSAEGVSPTNEPALGPVLAGDRSGSAVAGVIRARLEWLPRKKRGRFALRSVLRRILSAGGDLARARWHQGTGSAVERRPARSS